MKTKTYKIEYEFYQLAEVEIDEELASGPIKEMVEFWMGWENKLSDHQGDYVKAFLTQLGMFILTNGRAPEAEKDEGWHRLDGHFGIKVISWDAWEPAECDIFISEVSEDNKR